MKSAMIWRPTRACSRPSFALAPLALRPSAEAPRWAAYTTMSIWSTRTQSLAWLDNELRQESRILQEGFDFLEALGKIFEQIGDKEGENRVGQFCRVCLITSSKLSHLLLGCYSLALDALAQEAGALLRPLIEAYELLVYFRQDVARIDAILDGKLPSAGKIAKQISGEYQSLREHLNDNASHFSYRPESVRHLFGQEAMVRFKPTHSLKTLRGNLTVINAFQVFVLMELTNCLFAIGYNANSIADEVEHWRDGSVKVFVSEE